MMVLIVWKIICTCIVMAIVETAHGIVRAKFVGPLIGGSKAKRLSVITGSLLGFGVCYIMVPWIGVNGTTPLLIMGTAIAAFMLFFDIIMGRYVFKMAWKIILADFDIMRGGFLPFGLLALIFSPLIAMHLINPA